MKPIARIFAILTLAALPAYAMEGHEHMHHDMAGMEAMTPAAEKPIAEPVPEGAVRRNSRSVDVEAEVLSTALLSAKKEKEITFRLTLNGVPLTPDGLATVHTRKVHALIIDPTFTDYQHLHPEPTDTPGEYTVPFTPKTDRSYTMWLDLTPTDAPHAYLKLNLPGVNQNKAKIDRSATREATVGGYHFTLTFDDATITEDTPVMGHILVTDADGVPVDRLEPVMGAYAHVVGFYSDRNTIAHMHPMGAEPDSDDLRGGPTLDFHFEPSRKGFVKLFAQVKIDGKELFAPFGVEVK